MIFYKCPFYSKTLWQRNLKTLLIKKISQWHQQILLEADEVWAGGDRSVDEQCLHRADEAISLSRQKQLLFVLAFVPLSCFLSSQAADKSSPVARSVQDDDLPTSEHRPEGLFCCRLFRFQLVSGGTKLLTTQCTVHSCILLVTWYSSIDYH